MRIRNRTTQAGRDQQVIDGIRSDLQGVQALHLAGKQFTPASLEAYFEQRIELASRIAAARAEWQRTIGEYEATGAEARTVVRDLRNVVVGMFGDDSPKLAHFGFTPVRAVAWTDEKKAAAVARRAATRKARGTKGPRARLAITATTSPAAPSQPETATPTEKGTK